MSAADALQNALEELTAASACYGAAKRTNYVTAAGRKSVTAARARLERAADAYYTILMEVRSSG